LHNLFTIIFCNNLEISCNKIIEKYFNIFTKYNAESIMQNTLQIFFWRRHVYKKNMNYKKYYIKMFLKKLKKTIKVLLIAYFCPKTIF
jgi:hypothetical protein